MVRFGLVTLNRNFCCIVLWCSIHTFVRVQKRSIDNFKTESLCIIEMLLWTEFIQFRMQSESLFHSANQISCNILLVFDSMQDYFPFLPSSSLNFCSNFLSLKCISRCTYNFNEFKRIKLHSIIGRKLNSIAANQTDDELLCCSATICCFFFFLKWNALYVTYSSRHFHFSVADCRE